MVVEIVKVGMAEVRVDRFDNFSRLIVYADRQLTLSLLRSSSTASKRSSITFKSPDGCKILARSVLCPPTVNVWFKEPNKLLSVLDESFNDTINSKFLAVVGSVKQNRVNKVSFTSEREDVYNYFYQSCTSFRHLCTKFLQNLEQRRHFEFAQRTKVKRQCKTNSNI